MPPREETHPRPRGDGTDARPPPAHHPAPPRSLPRPGANPAEGDPPGVRPATSVPPRYRVRTDVQEAAPAPPRVGSGHASLTVSTPPPRLKRGARETRPPQGLPERTRWGREAMPPLGLGHLRDNLERSRGTAEDQGETRSHPDEGVRGVAAGQPSPAAGEGRSRDRTPSRRGGESVCRVTRPRPRRHHKARETEVGPESAPLPSPRHPRAAEERRGARRQNEKRSHVRHERPRPSSGAA